MKLCTPWSWGRRPRAKGMALIAVLWVVATLTILVTGLSRVVRGEVQIVASQRNAVEVQALGSAALTLALQELLATPNRPARTLSKLVAYSERQIAVTVAPINGWIDINHAPVPLLALLFEFGGGRPQSEAQALAQATVEFRSQPDSSGQPVRFEAAEELLRVPGIDYDLYARLSPLITVYGSVGGRVNPMAAPASVLAVLARGDTAVANRIAQLRDTGELGVDTTTLEASLIAVAPARRYHAEATVSFDEGRSIRVVRLFDVGASARDGLPWRVLHSDRIYLTPSR